MANPRKRRRARAAVANPRKRRRARAAVANPRKRRKASLGGSNPRRRHARANPHDSITEIFAAVAASAGGYLAADLLHRFFNTYNPAGTKMPTDKFVGGDGTAANAKNIALPPNWFSLGGQLALAVAPFVATHYGKIRGAHLKSSMQGFGIGAGAHLFGQVLTDFVLVKFLKNNSIVSRLFPQEIKSQTDAAAANLQVSGTLAGHPPLMEELHTMFPAVPKGLLHAYGVGYGPSYDAGSYSLQPQQNHSQHGHLSAPPPPPPPPPPGAPVTPFAPPPPPGGHEHHHGMQMSAPCPSPEARRSNLAEMVQTAHRELGQQCESLGLGRLPHQMNPSVDPRDANND